MLAHAHDGARELLDVDGSITASRFGCATAGRPVSRSIRDSPASTGGTTRPSTASTDGTTRPPTTEQWTKTTSRTRGCFSSTNTIAGYSRRCERPIGR
ncbi:Transcriptional regulator, contains HTH domain [Natrarchaeobaculum sulfurireducens]|uniref:Transcriptional regulator, contains HTH domain n=1 Tax=Natrarchaeobaculum sulfurireducens TaxID=2044521 RepID=A0A346PGB2_9EURY|nr:Transcriptional regulator, contains HTH domain [Natrarchaeobaculum sulfurireducens]